MRSRLWRLQWHWILPVLQELYKPLRFTTLTPIDSYDVGLRVLLQSSSRLPRISIKNSSPRDSRMSRVGFTFTNLTSACGVRSRGSVKIIRHCVESQYAGDYRGFISDSSSSFVAHTFRRRGPICRRFPGAPAFWESPHLHDSCLTRA